MRVRLLSLDLFDTLVAVRGFEPGRALRNSYETLKRFLEPKIDEEQFQNAYRTKIKSYLHQRKSSGKDFTNAELFASLLRENGILITLDQATAIANSYFESLLPFTQPFPKLKESLEYLAERYALIIISNHSWPSHGRATLKKFGIDSLFSRTIFSGDVGWAKPFSNIFETALSDLGVPRSEIIHIGDNPSTDVDGAIHQGIHSLWCRTRPHKSKTDPKIDILPKETASSLYLGEIRQIAELPEKMRSLQSMI